MRISDRSADPLDWGGQQSASSISFTCGYLGIPVLSLSNRYSALSDKQLHRTFLRTVPAFTRQIKIWLLLLRRLRYSSFVFIHKADQEGLAALAKVNEWAHKLKLHMERVISFEASYGTQYSSQVYGNEDQTTGGISLSGYDGFVHHNVRLDPTNHTRTNNSSMPDEFDLQADHPSSDGQSQFGIE